MKLTIILTIVFLATVAEGALEVLVDAKSDNPPIKVSYKTARFGADQYFTATTVECPPETGFVFLMDTFEKEVIGNVYRVKFDYKIRTRVNNRNTVLGVVTLKKGMYSKIGAGSQLEDPELKEYAIAVRIDDKEKVKLYIPRNPKTFQYDAKKHEKYCGFEDGINKLS